MVAPKAARAVAFTPTVGKLIVAKVSIPNGRRTIMINDEGKITAINTKTQVVTITVAKRGAVITQTFTQLQNNWKQV